MVWTNSGTSWDVVAVDATKLAGTQYGINASTRNSYGWSPYSVRNDSNQSAVVSNQIRWGSMRAVTKPMQVLAFAETTDNSYLFGQVAGAVPSQGYGNGLTFRHSAGSYTIYNTSLSKFITVGLGTNVMFFDGHVDFSNFSDSLALTDAGTLVGGPAGGEINYCSGNIKNPSGKNLVSFVGSTSGNLPWQDGN